MSKPVKALKAARIVLLMIVCAVVAFCLVMFVIHRIMIAKEEKLLAGNGYVNPISVGSHDLNVCVYGSSDPKHVLVGLSGLGMNDYSLLIRGVPDRFANDNMIVVVDRSGYGLSDDTFEPQTVEQIVADLRSALKNAGIPAPYVLLPHSIAGIYSTYWASRYPDEIEGVVFFDSTTVVSEDDVFDDYSVGALDYIYAACCGIGLNRLIYPLLDPSAFKLSGDDTRDIDMALCNRHGSSFALVSEQKLINRNCRVTYQSIVTDDIPKIYICANGAEHTKEDYIELWEHVKTLMLRDGVEDALPELTDDMIAERLEAAENFRNSEIIPFAENIGNCRIEYIVGDHQIYQQKPDECARVVRQLLDEIE